MRARILSLDSAEHRAAQELLPWFVNGTLGAAEAETVTTHLARCDRCRKDAAEQTDLRAIAPREAIDADVDRHWAALRDRLEPASRAPTNAGTIPGFRPWQRWLWPAVAVQAVVMLSLALLWVGIPDSGERYRALGSSPASLEPNAVVVFRADATNQQMRDALQEVGASIVGGPTVTDAYLLRLTTVSPDVLDRLRARPGVVRAEALVQASPAR